jgi:microsomal dipeptidase-like Zn-dependent dipeptidase
VLDRREFLSCAAAAALAAAPLARAAAPKRGFADQAYAKAIVIDGLGGPGGFEPDLAPDAGLSPSMLADVKASGVTAVNLTVNSVGNGPNKFEETVAGIAFSEKMIADSPDYFMKVLAARDLTAAKASGRMGLIYGFQDTSALDGDLQRLAMFQGRALVDVPRNTHDRELKALADRGGVVGIYFMPFLRASGQPHAEDVIRHLEHAVNVCGEDHVGLGTDGGISGIKLDEKYAEFQRKFFEERQKAGIAAPGEAADVFNLVPEYNDARRLVTLANDLSDRGWSAKRIEKILGTNFARLFGEVWG